MSIDINKVVDAAATKPFGYMPFRPGPGLGGHCIPIDPFYLSWRARAFGVTTQFIELAGEITRSMPNYVIKKLEAVLTLRDQELRDSKICVLGLSYKPNIDDIRESPSLELLSLLQQRGADVSWFDPFFSAIPSTRRYQHLQEIAAKNQHPLIKPSFLRHTMMCLSQRIFCT